MSKKTDAAPSPTELLVSIAGKLERFGERLDALERRASGRSNAAEMAADAAEQGKDAPSAGPCVVMLSHPKRGKASMMDSDGKFFEFVRFAVYDCTEELRARCAKEPLSGLQPHLVAGGVGFVPIFSTWPTRAAFEADLLKAKQLIANALDEETALADPRALLRRINNLPETEMAAPTFRRLDGAPRRSHHANNLG